MMRYRYVLLAVLIVMQALFAIVGTPLAQAFDQYPVSSTYFSGRGGSQYSFLGDCYNGTNSMWGSVMPNLSDKVLGSCSANIAAGGGAVGTEALGVSPSAGRGAAAVPGSANQALKQKFYDFLYKKYSGPGNDDTRKWEKAAAALIVHQMTGMPRMVDNGNVAWGNSYRTVSSDTWKELQDRLNEESLVMELSFRKDDGNTGGYPMTYNTVGVRNNDGSFDAVDYYNDTTWHVDSWLFHYSNKSNPVYVLEVECANPLGRLKGLNPAAPKDYSLNPSISADGMTSVEPGGEITIDGRVENTAANPSKGTEWRLTQIVYGPGASPKTSGGDSTAQPCDYFDSAGRIPPPCNAVDSGMNRIFDANQTVVVRDNYVYTVPQNAEFGTRFCFALSVKPPTEKAADQDKWRHSNLVCIMVSKSPKMQVWGGDVRAGGTINTSTRSYTGPNRTYGSWGEYGALSNGGNSGFGSGAGLNTGNPSGNQSSWGALTFANTGNTGPCRFGCYNFLLSSRGLVDQFIAGSTTPIGGNVDLNSLGSGTYTANNLTLTATTVSAGKSIIILSATPVTIEGSIAYSDGPYSNIRDIPQVVIEAPIINIRNSAGRVDAWLLAVTEAGNGVVNTCADAGTTDPLTSNICNNPLTVNGPVVADKIFLRRTAGSGGQPNERDTPAEIFNLRADAYLWGSGHGMGMNKARTVYTKELPPRF